MVSFGETRDPPPEKRASHLGNINLRANNGPKTRYFAIVIDPPVWRKRLKIQRTGANFTSTLDGTLAKVSLTSQAQRSRAERIAWQEDETGEMRWFAGAEEGEESSRSAQLDIAAEAWLRDDMKHGAEVEP